MSQSSSRGVPSRLDPEPVARRDFLGIGAMAAAGGACVLAGLGMLRLPKAAVLSSPSKKFRVTLPETLSAGQAYVPPGRAVAMFRDDGGVFAISLVCTHLGCIVKAAAEGFECPCHGSLFKLDGSVTRGPAPSPLLWRKVTGGGGSYVVDEGESVPPGTKVKA
jgi:cytochrome b6-f complex iron-sulfur subunit